MVSLISAIKKEKKLNLTKDIVRKHISKFLKIMKEMYLSEK